VSDTATPNISEEVSEATMTGKSATPGGSSPPDPDIARQKIVSIRSEAKQVLIERDVEIDLVLLSFIAKQHGILLGSGGIAKSMTIDTLMERIDAPSELLYKILMRKTTPPEELFGPLSIPALEREQFLYVTRGTMAEALVAFLDEGFKANAVSLNALLMAINERMMRNDGRLNPIPLWSAFIASNEHPNEPELAAFRDRFAWSREVKPVSTDDGFKAILKGAIQRSLGTNVPVTKITIPEMECLQVEAEQVDVRPVLDTVATMKRRAEGEFQLFISARRYVSGLKLCQAQAALNGRTALIEDDLTLFQHVLHTDPEDAAKAYEITLDYAGKVARMTAKLRESFEPYHAELASIRTEVPSDGSRITNEMAGRVASVQMNLKQVRTQIGKQIEEARADGRDTSELDALLAEVEVDSRYIREEILN
jgi:MoxR-like ATPase